MKDAKDPEITLFGRKILLPESGVADSFDDCNSGSADGVECDRCSDVSGDGEKVDEEKQLPTEEVLTAGLCDDKESKITNTVSECDANSNSEIKQQNEATGEQQKVAKKPDKVLPCPRCNSMETKFCYFNNYNTNQPRHFCKSCQRYWTAGGIMRNVPVGAGRRKNKNSASHCRHITISEALQATGGIDAFHYEVDREVDNDSNGSSVVTTNSPTANQQNLNIPFPGPAWQLPWNPAVPLPAVYPIPFYPAAPYWNFPWLSIPSPVTDQIPMGFGPISPLGKHSRNGELLRTKSKDSENKIVVPKTLRIDDPEEAAKSSIWETLGIKYDSTTREGLFKALQANGDDKKRAALPSPVLQANPAALSRSISFHEGS